MLGILKNRRGFKGKEIRNGSLEKTGLEGKRTQRESAVKKSSGRVGSLRVVVMCQLVIG